MVINGLEQSVQLTKPFDQCAGFHLALVPWTLPATGSPLGDRVASKAATGLKAAA
jgi:hypothetical protein